MGISMCHPISLLVNFVPWIKLQPPAAMVFRNTGIWVGELKPANSLFENRNPGGWLLSRQPNIDKDGSSNAAASRLEVSPADAFLFLARFYANL